jgi:hypothetical protein
MEPQKNTRPLALGLTILSGLARLLPHPPNFTTVGGMSLFAGARLAGWYAYLVPLFLMAITDALLAAIKGTPMSLVSPFVYASFLVNVWIGRTLLAHSENPIRIGSAAFLCSLQFFVVTNFAQWFAYSFYPHTLAGLTDCFIAAIPFYGRTLAGDLAATALLFGAHAWLSRRVASSERVALQTA